MRGGVLGRAGERGAQAIYEREHGLRIGGERPRGRARVLEQTGKTGRTKCLQQIIIFPHQSSWLGPWNYLMNAFLMNGYFHDPWHIAIYLCSGYVQSSDPEFEVV